MRHNHEHRTDHRSQGQGESGQTGVAKNLVGEHGGENRRRSQATQGHRLTDQGFEGQQIPCGRREQDAEGQSPGQDLQY